MAVLVSARSLSRVFPGGHRAVDGVDLDIQKGSVLGLVGESGCGKSTLSRLLLSLDKPSSGTVEFDGIDLGSLSGKKLRALRRRMQIVFQDPDSALDPRLSIRDSLEEGLRNIGFSREERNKRVHEAMDLVGLPSSRLDDFPHRFSGGQKQRIVIARSIAMGSEFLVLDEPVSSLDVSVQAQIVNLLVELKERLSLTYLFVSHDLDLVAYIADSIAVMKEGKIVEQGIAVELIDAPSHPYTRELFEAQPSLRRMAAALPQL